MVKIVVIITEPDFDPTVYKKQGIITTIVITRIYKKKWNYYKQIATYLIFLYFYNITAGGLLTIMN